MLQAGCRARLTGLKSKPELNDTEVALLELVEETGRWAVRGPACPDGIKVKPDNLVRSAPPFAILDDDALSAVCMRVPLFRNAAASCRRFRGLYASADFRRARVSMGFARVRVTIDPKEDLGEDSDFEDNDTDDLGSEGEYECIRHFSATVTVDGVRAGGLSATLINRTACVRHKMFLSACDAESQELLDIGSLLFDAAGKPRYAALGEDPAAKDGGFLYIGGFQMKAPFVGGGLTTVASQAIQELLTLKQLRYRYTVVAYIAEGRELEADPYGRGPRPVMRDPWAEPTAEEKLQMQKAWLRRVESDCRPFIRANFKEITHPKASEGWLYTTRTLQWRNAVVGGKYRGVQALPMLTHAAAMRVPLQASAKLASGTQPVPTPTELDCELHRTVYGREGPVKTDVIERLVKRGANINARDVNGMTPLMIAAYSLPKTQKQDPRCVNKLLSLGADTSLTGPDGLSALGYYRVEVLSNRDFHSVFTHGDLREDEKISGTMIPEIEAKLRPPAGPTSADAQIAA